MKKIVTLVSLSIAAIVATTWFLGKKTPKIPQ